MSSLLELVVPGVGLVHKALSKIQERCLEMEESQPACQHLHGQLQNLLKELHSMEAEDHLPSRESLQQYMEVETKFLRYLQRNHGKEFVFRVAENGKMNKEFRRLNEEVANVFELLDVAHLINWRDIWDNDRHIQDAILSSTIRDDTLILRDLQSSRAQVEALLTLKYEIEQRRAQNDGKSMEHVKLMMGAITAVSGPISRNLPL